MAELTNIEKLALQRKEKEQELALEKSNFSYDKLELMTGFQKDLISVLHRTVAKDTTNSELAYFLQVCKQSGLNPINKEIWCYKNTKGDLLVFTGRDGFLKKNKENPAYRGMRSSEVRENDEFEMDMIEGKVIHKFKPKDRGNLVGAYAIVSIEGQKDTIKWVEFSEFDLQQALWKTKPAMQIKKVAESHALKESGGVTGIQVAEAFDTTSGVARSTQDIPHEVVDKPEERLLLLIDSAESIDKLKDFQKDCKTQATMTAYDDKLKELQK